MIRKIINRREIIFLELKNLEINGKPLTNFKCTQFSETLAVHIKEYIKKQDAEVFTLVCENPELYNWMVFPLKGVVYAIIFMVAVSAQALQFIREFIQNYCNPHDLAYAYVFDSLEMIEGFIKNRVITKTDDSSLYRIGNKLYYMTNDEFHGLSEFFITGRLMSMCMINERGDVIISDDAYQKICSYLYRPISK